MRGWTSQIHAVVLQYDWGFGIVSTKAAQMADYAPAGVVVAGSFYSRGDFEVGMLGCKGAATDPDSVVCRLDDRFTIVCVEGEFREA